MIGGSEAEPNRWGFTVKIWSFEDKIWCSWVTIVGSRAKSQGFGAMIGGSWAKIWG